MGPLLELLFPPRCGACDVIGAEPFCAVCGELVDPVGVLSVPGVDWAWAEFEYGGPVSEAIVRMKYLGRPDLARPFGRQMRRSVEAYGRHFDVVLPVPTTWARLRERGFNPARELARAWPRRRVVGGERAAGPAQVGRSRRDRQANLRRAFSFRSDAVAGRRVLVVDDVITTGATVSTLAAGLRRAGAADVGVVAAACVR
jgi:ComF family protein